MPLRYDSISPEIARLTLARPERSNAFSLELLRAFTQRLDEIRADDRFRVLLIQAEGKNFCGGLDLAEAAQSEEKARQMPALVVEILAKLRRLPQVVLTCAQGAARAGGGALVAVSDLVVAGDDFSVAFPEIQRGLEPILLFPLLRRKLSCSALNELLLTGQPIGAVRAHQLGLVHQVVTAGGEKDAAFQLIEDILQADAGALKTAKELILVQETAAAGCSLKDEFARSLESHLISWHSPSGREGVTAFLEKRKPNFKSLTPDS